jgi:hypothetical protein
MYQAARWKRSAAKPFDAEDRERHRGGADIIELNAGITSEIGEEVEHRQEDHRREPQRRRRRSEPVKEGHRRGRDRRQHIAEDQRPQLLEIMQRVGHGVDQ